MARIVRFQGRDIQFPDTATDADIQAALASAGPAKNPDGTYGQPPAGEIIHGAEHSYISDHPEISASRLPGDERTNAITMETLKSRADAVKGGGDDFFPEWQRRAMPFTQGYSFNSADELLSNLVAGIKHPEALALGGAVPTDPAGVADLTQKTQAFQNEKDLAQEMQRQTIDRQRSEHPLESIAGNIAGGVSAAVPIINSGATIVGNIPRTTEMAGYWPMLMARMSGGAAEGGIWGALSGYFGADGDTSARVEQAKENLPLSMAVGAGAVPAVDLIGAILQPLANTWRSIRDPEGVATEKLAARMAADKIAPDQIASKLDDAAAQGQQDYRMVDAAGKNTQRLGAIAAKTPGEFRNEAANTMAARQLDQGNRISGYVDDAFGPGGKVYQTEQSLLASRKATAGPLYEKAYEAATPQGQAFTDMLGKQSVRDAAAAARRLAAEKQMPITDLFVEVPNPNATTRQVASNILDASGKPVTRTEAVDEMIEVPTMRGWDFIKKELDAKVNQLFAAGDTTTATAVKETRNQLRQMLSDTNPDYAKALQSYADDSSSLEAIEAGRQLISARNADEAKDMLTRVAPGDKDLAKMGAAREVGVRLENMGAGRDKTQLFNTPAMQGKVDAIVDDPVVRQVLADRLAREGDMVRSSRTMLQGSNTFENFADDAVLGNEGGALAALLTGQPLRALGLAAGTAMGKIGQRASGLSDAGAKVVGDYLMSSDPEKVRSLADMYRRALEAEAAPSVVPSIVNSIFNAPRTGREKQ